MYVLERRSDVTLSALQKEIVTVPLEKVADGSGEARGNDVNEGWINGLEMARLYGPGYDDILSQFPAIQATVDLHSYREHKVIVQVMVNKLAPHSALGIHRDGPPNHFRWHLPVITNELVYWYDELDGELHMECDKWYGPVNYCGIKHGMRNDGDTARYHLVVDLTLPPREFP